MGNDVFVECHLGFNEPAVTRVHNKAGSGCMIRESFQLNLDMNSSDGDAMNALTLLVKDQSLVSSTVLGRKTLTMREVYRIEACTGRITEEFTWSAPYFMEQRLEPEGRIWFRIAPVEEEAAPLMDDTRHVD